VYLKSLKLAGFKSFADRTRLELREGVTVIVGPNGSGKSNVVDALSWVLGTQSTKTLRTGKMEDVIFAGTATRPSLGKAEVTLMVDNTERRIDLDLDEISITRRLYRDGSSDYELNGIGCRLLDIQDLLSDAGVGRHQHVIIGQGEIGKVLNASPEEHRAVIEEAAGILKHRRRKERAERRLERTDEDMVRLQDLLGEMARQMRPLRRQAKAASRYQGLKDEVIALRLFLGGSALAQFDRDLTIATSEKARLHETLEVDESRIGDLASRLGELTDSAAKVGADLDRDTAAAAMLETTNERLRRISSVARERVNAISGRREAAVERSADLSEESAAIVAELSEITSQRREAETSVQSSEARFRQLEDQERALATQNALSPEGALAAVRGELSSLEAATVRDKREQAAIQHRLDVLSSQAADEKDQVERVNSEIKELDTELTNLQKAYDGAAQKSRSDQEAWSQAEDALAEARLAHASALARVDAIGAALEGIYDSEARELAEGTSGALGSLISQLDVVEGVEKAVEAALGRWVNAVAFNDVAAVRNVVERVKGAGGGSVPVVTTLPQTPAPARTVADSLGLEALIDRLGPKAHSGFASQLLGDVVLVEGWVSGWDLVRRHPELRAVTPEGDLITSEGVHIANPDGAGPAMLESSEVALERAVTELARAESIHKAARRDFDLSRNAERESLERLESVEAALAGRSEAMARLQQSVDAVSDEGSRLGERISAITESIESAALQMTELRDRLSALEGEEASRLQVWEETEARRSEVAAEREAARSAWQEASGALREIVGRERLLIERSQRIDLELKRIESGSDANVDPDRLEMVEDLAKRAVSILEKRIIELRDRQAALREENSGVLSGLDAVRAEHDARTQTIQVTRRRIGELDVKLTELRLHREAIIESIRRDADADVDRAIGAPRPDYAEDDDLEEILGTKLAQLGRLGPINPLAAAEYTSLEERHTFLSDQMKDVESSRDELRKVIVALDSEIADRFNAAFDEVASAYERYFEVLFPGGRGQIRLLDPDAPESGVSIEAQPLGKKVSQMTLLSGGERSLAALAFLFAIFDARPSPFYVLDEVEAALDDANLRRFIRIVDEFRQQAQLIIVTHQQQTMEAADVLYGVTMEPGGSSQAVRKDMTVVQVENVA